jgi:hypothetical protein
MMTCNFQAYRNGNELMGERVIETKFRGSKLFDPPEKMVESGL